MVKMVQLDKNWTSSNPTPRSIREIRHPISDDAILLPGGRWLLFITNDDPPLLVAYDLDTPAMVKQVLSELPTMWPEGGGDLPNICAVVDGTPPALSWTLLVPYGGE